MGCVAGMAVLIALLLCVAAMGEGRRVCRFPRESLAGRINRVIQVESRGDPNATGGAGERGLMQILPGAWRDGTRHLGVDWPFDDAWDPIKNIIIGTGYYDQVLPKYFDHYGIPDTPYTRLAAYNWGIGNLANCYARHAQHWFDHLPAGVRRHCLKWRDAVAPDYVDLYFSGELCPEPKK